MFPGVHKYRYEKPESKTFSRPIQNVWKTKTLSSLLLEKVAFYVGA